MDSSTSSPLENLQHHEKTITPMDVDTESHNEQSPKSEPPRPANALSKLIESDSDSERDRVPTQNPRGNLLSRLQPQKIAESSDSEEDEDDGSAYERVKKSLMLGLDQTEEHKELAKPIPTVEASSSDDEEGMPTRANNVRRLAPRKEPRSSPHLSRSPSLRSRRPSPGLFVNSDDSDASPIVRKIRRPASVFEDSGDSAGPKHNRELEDRVQRIRAERLAKQREKREQARQMKSRQANKEDSDSDPDGENGRRLTQSSRPTRKAGKKALEDIAREQQRISRNMQLTHQAKTKKKYGMKDLLSKFGLGQVDSEIVAVPTPDASSVLASSDVEGNHIHDTPPTSPPSQDDDVEKETHISDAQTQPAKGTPVPELALFSPSAPSVISKTDKGKGRAPEFEHVPQNPLIKQSQPITANSVLESKTLSTSTMIELSDSDEDFNVIKAESRFPVFDRLPQQKRGEAPSLLHLRHLAHLTSPGKKGPKGKQSMNITELQLSLIHKARRQAQKERDEKIEDLRRRGIHIETEEERAKLQMEIEDMAAQFEKARQEDLKLGKLERDEAKKNGEALDDLPSSDESDADYAGSDAEEADAAELEQDEEEDADIELSGSEDEEMAEDDDVEEVDDEEMSDRANGLLDDAAEEDDEEDQDELENGDDLEDETVTAPSRKRTMNRARNVVVDDEDESADEAPKMSMPTQQSTQLSHTQEDSGMAAFGFNNAGPTLGLTQMFAGTMADLNSESQNAHSLDNEPEQDSLDFLRSLPDTQPGHLFDEDPDMLVPNSQAGTSHQNDSQPTPARQMTLGITQLLETSPAFSHTQASETFEPTQDAGFELSRSPAGLIPPPSTIDTVMMPIAESPITKRKGRLHQRKEAFGTQISDVEDVEDIDTTAAADEQLESQTENAFAALAKAAKKLKKKEDNFNKKTSWARDAIEEQAEESEDEYAGIGGGSDEDSGEEDEELAQMIDTNDIKVDERKLAAFYAEKAKKQDEKDINQIYKDIMNGGFRKRRGGDGFEMSDEEDEIEQRRRKKQMQFKQQTKALMADERLAQIGHNPKKAAFFQTLADHMEDPDYEFLDAPGMDANQEPSQSQSDENNNESQNNEITVPDSQTIDIPAPVPINPLKRKAPDSQDSQKENRPPPHKRRTAATDNMIARKPMTLADVQHSVSELLEDHRIIVPNSQLSDSDSELEIEPPTKFTSRNPIIDRLTLSRQNSALSETTDSANGGMAFHAAANGVHQPGFRIPSLVRRATSNFSTVSTGSSGASTPSETSVRRGGTGRSNIHAQAREAERRAAVEKVELKRKETLKKKVAAKRGKRSVLGSLDQGFE